MIHLSLDPGSTHLGDKRLAQRLIDVAAHAYHTSGAGDRLKMSVKFQLFKRDKDSPNIELNRDLFQELVQYGRSVGIPVTASVFDQEALALLFKLQVPYVKFAYSKRLEKDWIMGSLRQGMTTVVSTNSIDLYELPLTANNLVTLYCEPTYPAMGKMEFEDTFPPFTGYSDHHRGLRATEDAVRAGATWIERHMTLDDTACLSVPDGRFALKPARVTELAKRIWTWTPSS